MKNGVKMSKNIRSWASGIGKKVLQTPHKALCAHSIQPTATSDDDSNDVGNLDDTHIFYIIPTYNPYVDWNPTPYPPTTSRTKKINQPTHLFITFKSIIKNYFRCCVLYLAYSTFKVKNIKKIIEFDV